MEAQVGCRALTAPDPVQGATIRAWLLYPSQGAAKPVSFGPYEAELAMDGAPAAQQIRLVALSHGNGGTPWSHRGLATHLAREGFAVLMIEHPGNNRHDNSLGSPTGRPKAILLSHRPRHVVLAVNAALADSLVGPHLASDGYAMIGESIGAYTALAVAGGRAHCLPDDVDEAVLSRPMEELAKVAVPVKTERDPRLRSAVLFVPAIGFFGADGALAEVSVPLLVRTAERDALVPASQVAHTLRSLPDPSRVFSLDVPGAGHCSLHTPYPPALAGIPPAQDPPGFDRAAYQAVLKADVTAFLRSTLGIRRL
ncbi:MAG: hypothetical protein R3B70_04190 [Polyangiaceae bacterium]